MVYRETCAISRNNFNHFLTEAQVLHRRGKSPSPNSFLGGYSTGYLDPWALAARHLFENFGLATARDRCYLLL